MWIGNKKDSNGIYSEQIENIFLDYIHTIYDTWLNKIKKAGINRDDILDQTKYKIQITNYNGFNEELKHNCVDIEKMRQTTT